MAEWAPSLVAVALALMVGLAVVVPVELAAVVVLASERWTLAAAALTICLVDLTRNGVKHKY